MLPLSHSRIGVYPKSCQTADFRTGMRFKTKKQENLNSTLYLRFLKLGRNVIYIGPLFFLISISLNEQCIDICVCALRPRVFSVCQRRSRSVRSWVCLGFPRKRVAFFWCDISCGNHSASFVRDVDDAPSTCLRHMYLCRFHICKRPTVGTQEHLSACDL